MIRRSRRQSRADGPQDRRPASSSRASRPLSEGLDKALLGGIEQQLACGGILDPIVAAKIEIVAPPGPDEGFAEIYVVSPRGHAEATSCANRALEHLLAYLPLQRGRPRTLSCRHAGRGCSSWRCAAPAISTFHRDRGQQNLAQLISSSRPVLASPWAWLVVTPAALSPIAPTALSLTSRLRRRCTASAKPSSLRSELCQSPLPLKGIPVPLHLPAVLRQLRPQEVRQADPRLKVYPP